MTLARSAAVIGRTTSIMRPCMAARVSRISPSAIGLAAMSTLRRSPGFGVRVTWPLFASRSSSAVVEAEVMPR